MFLFKLLGLLLTMILIGIIAEGEGYNLLDPGIKSCPEGLGIFEVADCEEACNNLGIRLSNKRFKKGKPCYKGTSNVCNQNGGFGKNARIICKQEGCADMLWCSGIENATDCCSTFIQEQCPVKCDTCPATTQAPTLAPGTLFIEHKGEKSCSSGSTITNSTECISACTELGVVLGKGVESGLRDGKECYKAGNGKCRQDAHHGVRASLICKNEATTDDSTTTTTTPKAPTTEEEKENQDGYKRISSGNCASFGMELVSSKEECELAATSLGLSDATAVSSDTLGRPHGCIYASNDWLNWHDPLSSPHTSVPCGSKDGSHDYDCLCKKHEIVVYGDIRSGRVFYQVAHATGQLDCYFRRKGESEWYAFGTSTYHSGYAECSGWSKGNPDYDIRLELNGKEYLTDEETAISKGPYASAEETTTAVPTTTPVSECDFEHTTVDEQITSCQGCGVSGSTFTCTMPTVSYGSASGGVPTEHSGNRYEDWCREMGFSGPASVITKSEYYSGQLFWCSGYDDTNYKWCDWSDGSWKDATLGHYGTEQRIQELTCGTVDGSGEGSGEGSGDGSGEGSGSGVISWSQTMPTGTVSSTSTYCTSMETFQASLVGKQTTSVTLGAGGSSYNCTDAATAKQITDAFSTCVGAFSTCTSQSFSCNGVSWWVGKCGRGGEIGIGSSICSCTGTLSIRPCIDSYNWGGLGSNTCGQSSQTLSVTVNYSG